MQALLQLAAERVQLFLSAKGQSHAILPSGAATPIWNEDSFTFLVSLCDAHQMQIPFGLKLGNLLRTFDAQAHASNRTQTVPLRTAHPDPQTLLIDLQEDLQAIEVTSKGWTLTNNFDQPFLRPALNLPLPIPEQPQQSLTAYLQQLFQIQEKPAQLLSDWLATALLPDAKPPILVITGEARDEAASKLRMLLDPVAQPIVPFPANTNQLGQLALTNRVLAFVAYNKVSETRMSALNRLRKGMPVRLKETNQRRAQIFENVARPIIIAAEGPQQISNHQITVVIDHAHQGDHPQILGALLNEVAKALGRPTSSATDARSHQMPESNPVKPDPNPPGP